MTDSTLKGITDCFTKDRPTLETGVRGNPSSVLSKSHKPDRPIILKDTANLRIPLSSIKLTTTACNPRYMVTQCGCRRNIIPSTCMSLLCTNCAPWIGKRRKDSIRRRFERYRLQTGKNHFNRPVCYTVFTVPLEIRHRLLDKNYLRKVRQEIWNILKDKYGALFGLEATHPRGESGEVFHPHLNFLWMTRVGVSAYMDVDSLRQDWADVLGVSVADMWHKYSTKTWLINHWCKYVSRVFPGFHQWTGSIRWYGKYPRKQPAPEILCADCGQSFRIIGHIDAQIVSDYYARGWLLGLDPPWYDNKKLTLYKKRGKHASRSTEDVGTGVLYAKGNGVSEGAVS